MELKWLYELVEVLKKRKKLLICVGGILVAVFYFLPEIGYFYYWLTLMVKVDSSRMNFSRLNLLQILISILSPVLTFLVLMNSVANQKLTNDRLDLQSEESKRRLDSEQVSNSFYKLLEVFTKIQERVNIEELKEKTKFLEENNKGVFLIEDDYLIPSKNPDIVRSSKYHLERFLHDNSDIEEDKLESLTSKQRMALAVNIKFEQHYENSSQYFKAFHRIVKILNVSLNTKKINEDEYHSYIGILRANLSSNEMEIILMNSLFVKRGIGLALELIGTDFFGNEDDYEVEQHFINIWKNSKKELMSKFIDDKKGENREFRNILVAYFRKPENKAIDNFNELYYQHQNCTQKKLVINN
ncbi:putative phage abortive infection protein (plasmid) [Lactococcus lactis]|uniref:putative phage abortive infection protein n=1 Tax=Lactococcus lactis TaxID=1358 RepID=UPI0033135410